MLPRRKCCRFLLSAFFVAAGCLMPLSAMPALQGEVTERYNALPQGDACTLLYEGWQVLLLTDDRSAAAALVVTAGREKGQGSADMVALDLAEKWRMDEVRSFTLGKDAALVVRDSLVAEWHGPIMNEKPVDVLGCLLAVGYYHPTAVTPEGRLIMKSGKKHSIDLQLPLTPRKVNGIELLPVGLTVDTRTANVLAKKMGYHADVSSAQDKKRIKGELRANEVVYALNNPAMVMAQGKNKRWYFGTKEVVAVMMKAQDKALTYPAPRQPAAPAAPAAVPPPKAAPTPAQQPKENRPLTPAEALKIYIQRLNGM